MFSKNLKIERKSKNLTQSALAEMLGIKTQSYQAYEKGISMPSAENLLKLELILNVSLNDLFELDI